MKCIGLPSYGAKEVMITLQQPIPQLINQHHKIAKVLATSINRADILQRQGKYPVPPHHSKIMGLDCVCQIDGQIYLALLNGGGYAQYTSIDMRHTVKIHKNLKIQESAAIIQAWVTAYQICELGQISKGKRVLIYAGGSGVGTAAIQTVKILGGIPIALCSGQQKIKLCSSLGAKALDYKVQENWQQIVAKQGKVDVILDCVGKSHFNKGINLLNTDGHLILYGLLSGSQIQNFNLGSILGKRLNIIGTTLRSRSDDYKAGLIARFNQKIYPYFKQEIKPIISNVIKCDWDDQPQKAFKQGHSLIQSNKTIGKVVVIYK